MKMATVLIVLFFAISLSGVVDTAAQSNDLKILSVQRLAESKARIEYARRVAAQNGWVIRGVGANDRGFSLQWLAPNGMPEYFISCNGTSATSTRTDSVWTYVGGAPGERVFMWDEGVPLLTHQEFGGRITWGDASSPGTNNHSTHVAGTMVAACPLRPAFWR